MKPFPFRILFACIFLPPICYVLTLQLLEGYFQRSESSILNEIAVRNYEALYDGQYTVKEEINRNIGEYLSRNFMYRLGVRTIILVKTKDNQILYPVEFSRGSPDQGGGESFSAIPEKLINYVDVAAENYRILNKGLSVSVDVDIEHNSWLSNGILVFYVFLSVLVLRRVIQKRLRETEKKETGLKELIQDLSDQLAGRESGLKEAETKEAVYREKIAALKREKKDLTKDLDGFLEEMEDLETGLKAQRELREETEQEVVSLREDLDRLKDRLLSPKKKKKKGEKTLKRFRVLYKNLFFTERAVEGFVSLTDDFQLKGEEIIHKLNEDETQVVVKRKVFGKGGKMNMLEADFAYSGRIYFQKDSRAGIRVMAIGTKNTQGRDLAFLESMREK
jgi:hypothetical protein